MGILDKILGRGSRFRWQEKLSPISTRRLAKARALVSQGQHQQALKPLMDIFSETACHRETLELSATALEALGGAEAELFRKIIKKPGRYEPWFELGNHFLSAMRDELALPFLRQAYALDPGNEDIASLLTIALASECRHAEVVKILKPYYTYTRDPGTLFQFSWSALLNRDPDLSKKALERLPDSDEVNLLKEKVEAALLRYKAFPPPDTASARDWLFIEYGSLLLDLNADEQADLGGRYFGYWPPMPSVRAVLFKAARAMEAMDWEKGKLYYFNRDGEILARVLQEFGAGVAQELPKGLTPPGVLIMAECEKPDDWQQGFFPPVRPGVRHFSFALDWDQAAPFVPDMLGVLWRSGILPWNGGYRVAEDSNGVAPVSPRTEPPGFIAKEVLEAEKLYGIGLEELTEFAATLKDYMRKPGKPVRPYLPDMPLPSVRLPASAGMEL